MAGENEPKIIRGPTMEEQEKMFWNYIRCLGLCVHSWNGLIESLADLYAFASKNENAARGEWHNKWSDKKQIRLLLQLAKSTHDRWASRLPKAKKDLIWLAEQAEDLIDKRNNLLHSPYTLYCGLEGGMTVRAAAHNGNKRAMKLDGFNLAIEFNYFRGRADALSSFAKDCQAPLRGTSGSWPDRPGDFNISNTTSYITTIQML